MAAAITTASSSVEQQALEVLMSIQALEANATANPNNNNFVTGTYNSDTKVYAGTFSIPATQTIGAGGVLQITANQYLQPTV